MRVRLWVPWPGDGATAPAGTVVDVPESEAVAICGAGAGEFVEDNPLEFATLSVPEQAVRPRGRRRRKR